MAEFDNTNRGSAWLTKATKGKLDVQGHNFFMDIVQTGRPEGQPAYNIYLLSDRTKKLYGGVLFKDNKNENRLASGSIDLTGEGLGEFWVSMFLNKSDSDRSPVIDISVQVKEPKPDAYDGTPPPPDDNPPSGDGIPF